MTAGAVVRGSTTRALVAVDALAAVAIATDNALGFVGVDPLPRTITSAFAAVCTLVGLVVVVQALRTRELLAASIAVLLIGFLGAGPSVVLVSPPAFVVTIIQTLLPFGFGLVAWVIWRSARGASARLGALGMLLLTSVWAIGALTPIPLDVFLTVQILAVVMLVILVIGPGWRWLGARVVGLWRSADIR